MSRSDSRPRAPGGSRPPWPAVWGSAARRACRGRSPSGPVRLTAVRSAPNRWQPGGDHQRMDRVRRRRIGYDRRHRRRRWPAAAAPQTGLMAGQLGRTRIRSRTGPAPAGAVRPSAVSVRIRFPDSNAALACSIRHPERPELFGQYGVRRRTHRRQPRADCPGAFQPLQDRRGRSGFRRCPQSEFGQLRPWMAAADCRSWEPNRAWKSARSSSPCRISARPAERRRFARLILPAINRACRRVAMMPGGGRSWRVQPHERPLPDHRHPGSPAHRSAPRFLLGRPVRRSIVLLRVPRLGRVCGCTTGRRSSLA